MAIAAISSSSGVPLPYGSDTPLSDSNSSSSGSVNSCGEGAPQLVAPKTKEFSTAVTSTSYPQTALKVTDSNVAFRLFTVSNRNISEINGEERKPVLILKPISIHNPDCSSIEAAELAIRSNRVVLGVFDKKSNFYVLHGGIIEESKVQKIFSVIISDFESSFDALTQKNRTFQCLSKPKNRIKSRLDDEILSCVDRTFYKASDVFGCAAQQLRMSTTEILSKPREGQISQLHAEAEKRRQALEDARQADDLATSMALTSLLVAGNQSQAYGHYIAPTVTPQQARMLVNAQSKNSKEEQCVLQ